MDKKWLTTSVVLLISITALLFLFGLTGGANAGPPEAAPAMPLNTAPTVIEVDPTSAPNDLGTPIVITGTGFAISATVQLDGTELDDVGWVSSTS